jgi:toxin ParE1/3/4
MRIRWTVPALRELEAIGDCVARENPNAADQTIARIFECADLLGTQPNMGGAGRVPGTRELIVSDTPFIAPYRVLEDRVEILAVFHGARRWPDTFN